MINSKNEEITLLKEKEKKYNEQEKELNHLKSLIPFDIEDGQELMFVIICTYDQINYPMICKKSQTFKSLEDSLYEKKPEYKETKQYFLCNTNIIEASKTLEENNINDGDTILMIKIEEDI